MWTDSVGVETTGISWKVTYYLNTVDVAVVEADLQARLAGDSLCQI